MHVWVNLDAYPDILSLAGDRKRGVTKGVCYQGKWTPVCTGLL